MQPTPVSEDEDEESRFSEGQLITVSSQSDESEISEDLQEQLTGEMTLYIDHAPNKNVCTIFSYSQNKNKSDCSMESVCLFVLLQTGRPMCCFGPSRTCTLWSLI